MKARLGLGLEGYYKTAYSGFHVVWRREILNGLNGFGFRVLGFRV